MPALLLICSCLSTACPSSAPTTSDALDCLLAQQMIREASEMRTLMLERLEETAEVLGVAQRLEAGLGRHEHDALLARFGGNIETVERLLWQHSEAASAWCLASQRVSRLLESAFRKMDFEESSATEATICSLMELRNFSPAYPSDIVLPRREWADRVDQHEKRLLDSCRGGPRMEE